MNERIAHHRVADTRKHDGRHRKQPKTRRQTAAVPARDPILAVRRWFSHACKLNLRDGSVTKHLQYGRGNCFFSVSRSGAVLTVAFFAPEAEEASLLLHFDPKRKTAELNVAQRASIAAFCFGKRDHSAALEAVDAFFESIDAGEQINTAVQSAMDVLQPKPVDAA